MIVVVNDAHVLIDLVKLQLLPHFFKLDMAFHTTDLIMAELHDEQREQLRKYQDTGRLTIVSFTEQEVVDILLMQAEKPQLSQQDCSAVVCAQKVNGNLLTSDNTLRKFAMAKKLTVCGHLWILDRMVEQHVLAGTLAIEKLAELREKINTRLSLPKQECEIRIAYWKTL
jgi:predicted nucleic acid-binding protein